MKLRSSLATINKEVAKQSTALVKKEGVERVVAVIDHSGSMSDHFHSANNRRMSRMEAVIEAIHYIIDSSSRATTQIGLIGFSSQPEQYAAPTDKFSSVKVAALQLHPTSSTHFAPALDLALETEPDRVILLSDGEANDKDHALQVVQTYIERNIKIDTVGIGDKGLDLLKQIAELTGGIFMFADNFEKLQEAFAKLETRARLLLEHKS